MSIEKKKSSISIIDQRFLRDDVSMTLTFDSAGANPAKFALLSKVANGDYKIMVLLIFQ